MPPSRFETAIARFDDANREDPHTEYADAGVHPRELLYARRMTAWLDRLAPDASEALRLAVRCQHIQRWKIPRSAYPMDRQGYRQWRTDLAAFHAETAGAILRDAGYEAAMIGRVQALVRKERFKTDREAQLLEDTACLVFLEYYLADFAEKHPEEKLLNILRKTWAKMSPAGHAAARTIALPPRLQALVARALAQTKEG
jgi:hypothetical protein